MESFLLAWVQQLFPKETVAIQALPGEASHRHFYRCYISNKTFVAVYSPPALEDNHTFVEISKLFTALALPVPEIMHHDLEQGFILEADLGDHILYQLLSEANYHDIYRQAFLLINKLQIATTQLHQPLALFDKSEIEKEFSYFQQWFLDGLLKLSLTPRQQATIDNTFARLIKTFTEQPQVLVHRDFHSRNLLLTDNEITMVDFQDALMGPITYDLVSLLKDCYIAWPKDQTQKLALEFLELLKKQNTEINISPSKFLYWFDMAGLQRHIKVLGIFSRLSLRDNNHNYLQHLPRILNYALDTCHTYPELRAFGDLLASIKQQALAEVSL